MHTRVTKRIKKVSRGFTLIELMVSLVIFSIVMMVSTGTLLIMIDINAKAQAIYSSTTNLSFALDSITREIRMGKNHYCDSSDGTASQPLPNITLKRDCLTVPGDFISFTRNRDGQQIGYRLVVDTSNPAQPRGVIQQKERNAGVWLPLTSDDVDVSTFEIVVDGSQTYYADGDTNQPVIDLFIAGTVNNGLDTPTDFSVQSRMVKRALDS